MLLVSRLGGRRLALAALFSISSWSWAGTYSPCDLNQDGVINSLDVNLAVSMAIGSTPCSASIEASGVCTPVTVQRVVNASLGGTCITYNTHGVTLNWTASTSSGVTGYNVYRSTTNGGPYTKITATPVTSGTSYSDSAVQAGQTYYYVATTVTTSGESGYSSQVSGTIPNP